MPGASFVGAGRGPAQGGRDDEVLARGQRWRWTKDTNDVAEVFGDWRQPCADFALMPDQGPIPVRRDPKGRRIAARDNPGIDEPGTWLAQKDLMRARMSALMESKETAAQGCAYATS